MTSSVALVLDSHFGSAVEVLAQQMPVWIISSSENDLAVERLRTCLKEKGRVTSLLPILGESERERIWRALYDIDEHHGVESSASPYEQVVIYGSAPELVSREIMKELGFVAIANRPGDFCLRKSTEAK